MKQSLMVLLLAMIALAATAFAQTGCSQFNGNYGPYIDGHTGIYQHITGAHASAMSASGSCTYTGAAGQACANSSRASSLNPSYSETGTHLSGYHVGNGNAEDGATTATGGLAASSTTTSAVAFRNCQAPGCGVVITFLGAAVTFPPDAIFTDKFTYTMTCAGKTAPPVGCTGNCSGPGSPVAIATGATRFADGFSDPKTDCVLFDLKSDGNPICISWPKDDSGIAWLVLPDENGNVTSGAQLFGNYTPQPNHYNATDPNGFLALAEWDTNTDLVIDKNDDVWTGKRKLRLWFPTHCRQSPSVPCTAEPGELRPLEKYGIQNISLVYGQGAAMLPGGVDTDASNNQFKFCSMMNVKGDKLQESPDGRFACDVWVQAKQ